MKNALVLFFPALLAVFSVRCGPAGNTEQKEEVLPAIDRVLVNLRKEIPGLGSFDQIICIPGEGCGGCISRTTGYVYHNIDSLANTLIIFTGVKDKKLLRSSLGQSFLNRENVFVDRANWFMSTAIASIYPQVFYLREGTVLERRELDPEYLSLSPGKSDY